MTGSIHALDRSCIYTPTKLTILPRRNEGGKRRKQGENFFVRISYRGYFFFFDPAKTPTNSSCPHVKSRGLLRKLGRGHADTVRVTVEENRLAFSLGSHSGLNPLAYSGASPEGLEESGPARVCFRAVMQPHYLLNGLAGLVGVVEWDGADIVVQNVCLDNTVENVTANKSEVAVNSGSCSAGEIPSFGVIMRESGVGVLKVGDGNCRRY